MDSPKKQASKILRDKKMYQRWLAIFMCLALVVTSGTVTALKLTGQAWTGTEQVYACTYTPHQHTEQCYDAEGKLVCGYSDLVLHTHDARCYDSEGSLICTMEELEEHSHTSECYTEVKTLICTEEEHEAIPAHKHSDECYTTETVEQKDLTCGLEEGANAVEAQPAVEGHHHTDACYTITPAVEATYDEEGNELTAAVPEQRTLTCGLEESEGQPAVEAVPGHVHTEECYTTQQVEKQVLTCGLEEHDEEIPAHHHTNECYTTEMVLNCDKPELIAHEHTDDCYEIELDADGNEISRTLTCKLPQLVAHQHGDECFTEVALEAEGTYCGKEAHKHSGSCYMEVNGELVLTCDKEEHVHTDECFVEPVLYCGKQEHTHTDECWQRDENGEFVLDENGEKILICELEEHTHTEACYVKPEAVEVTETVANRFYNVELTAAYTGALAEGDELAITAATVGQDEMESDRDYEYTSKVTDSKILPLGRTEFVLTKNGEEVDRSEYAITATITPSRESVAYLVMGQGGGADSMMLDEGGEDAGQTLPVQSGFTVYELADGQLAAKGYSELALDGFDWDAYMAEAYDEQGNPAYDEALAIHAHLDGSDFMLASGVEEEVIQTLSNYDQQYYDDRIEVWWDEYQITSSGYYGNSYKGVEPDHIDKVTMTHSTSAGEKSGSEFEINEGNSDAPKIPDGTQIGNFYPDAEAGSAVRNGDWVDAAAYPELKDSTTYIRLTFSNGVVVYDTPGSNVRSGLNSLYMDQNGRTLAKYNTVNIGDTLYSKHVLPLVGTYYEEFSSITKIEYYKEAPAAVQQMDYALLEITPKQGYYVTDVVIACVHSGHKSNGELCQPWDCGIFNDSNAFQKSFSVADGTKASVVVPSEAFSHGSYDGYYKRCYILVRTAAIPSPLFVKYDPGTIGTQQATAVNPIFSNNSSQNGWMDNKNARSTATGNVTSQDNVDRLTKTNGNSWQLSDDGKFVLDLRYTTAGVSEEAKQAAAAKGYEFAGWKIEYFNTATINGETATESNSNEKFDKVVLSDSYGTTPGTVGAKQPVDLIINAVLTAQWKAIPAASVTKTVSGLEDDAVGETHTFQFTVKDAEGNIPEIDTEVIRREEVDGKPTDVSYIVDGANPFSITITGNETATYKVYGLQNGTYTVEETETGEAKTTTVNGTVGTKTTFTVSNSASGGSNQVVTTANNIQFVNDYSDVPLGQMVKIEKFDESNNKPLAGATFTLTTADKQEVAGVQLIISQEDGLVMDATMLPVGEYVLAETGTPDGYEPIEDIHFTVDENVVKVDDPNAPVFLSFKEATETTPKTYTLRVNNTVADLTDGVIKKMAAGNDNSVLPNAEFDLYKVAGEGEQGDASLPGIEESLVKVNEAELKTGEQGTVNLPDLKYGATYYLVETKAPDGYNASGKPIKIEYVKDDNGFKISVSAQTDTNQSPSAEADVDGKTVIVYNSAGVEMPHTGGIGTHGFMIGGGLLIMLAAGLLILNKRRRAAEQ